MENRRGKCKNFGNCAKADRGEIIELSFTEDFVCPDCNDDLVEETPPSKPPIKKILIGILMLAVLGGAGFGIYKLLTKEGTETTVTASVTDTPKGPEKPSVDVESVSLDQSSLSLKVGDNSVTLKPTVSPDNATNKDVVWSSSDETVASVNNGNVTAVKKGTTVITAKSVDGSEKSAVCNVTVTDVGTPPPPPRTYPCGDYKGEKSSNGKAHGLGTFTYSSRTLIDDIKMIYAEKGDYITGTFRDDKIVSVQLYGSGGNLKQTVIPQQSASICR